VLIYDHIPIKNTWHAAIIIPIMVVTIRKMVFMSSEYRWFTYSPFVKESMTMQLHGRPHVMACLSIMTGVLILSGCAAVHTSIAKKDLDVQTKMSDTVFLDPVGPDKKIVFVQIRNTSDKPFEIEGPIVTAIAARGYRITLNPDEAQFRLLGNVLSVAKASPTAAEVALAGGYGGVLGGSAWGLRSVVPRMAGPVQRWAEPWEASWAA
jgi:Enterobacterial TraT complement resistance protein